MPNNKLNNNNSNPSLNSLMRPQNFNALTEENKKAVIDTIREVYSKEKEGGFLGKFLGTNRINASMHIAFIICLALIVVGSVIKESNIWDKILTLIATAIGYVFGTTQKENSQVMSATEVR